MDKLTQYRKQLDELDQKLMELLEARFQVISEIKDHKAKHHLPVYDEKRETEILKKCESFSHHDAIKAVYNQILTVSKNIQQE